MFCVFYQFLREWMGAGMRPPRSMKSLEDSL